jgi:hypothetical protein
MTVSARQVLHSGPVEHLVFSDGLASVSVFVEIGREQHSEQVSDDAATIGSSSAYSTVVQGYRVTAVGEVPPDTVRAIAQAIRAAAPEPSMAESLLGVGMPRNSGNRAGDTGSIFDALSGTQGSDAKLDNHGMGSGRSSPGSTGAAASFGMPSGAGPGTSAFGAAAGASPVRH